MNPIDSVLAQLNISFPAGKGSTTTATIGMNVEKVGRTTEYTTSTVKEIDATVVVGYDFGNATFDKQITTAWMSDPGDSGSVVFSAVQAGLRIIAAVVAALHLLHVFLIPISIVNKIWQKSCVTVFYGIRGLGVGQLTSFITMSKSVGKTGADAISG